MSIMRSSYGSLFEWIASTLRMQHLYSSKATAMKGRQHLMIHYSQYQTIYFQSKDFAVDFLIRYITYNYLDFPHKISLFSKDNTIKSCNLPTNTDS